MMDLEVKGHSGCSIDIRREGDSLYVYKSTSDPSYLKRLLLQGQKQREAAQLKLQHIRVPKVLDIVEEADSVTIKMEYIYSKSFVRYFEYAGFEQISYFIQALCLYLDYEIQHSPIQTVKASVLSEKFDDVRNKVGKNAFLNDDAEIEQILSESSKLFTRQEDMLLPVGVCHGDLTFSNILFNGNNYYLIDYLDSFVESPLLDIVKIRQDSAYLWSQLMYLGENDSLRLQIVADKIDQDIRKYASQFDWFKYYPIFQIMNFLRILQYAKDGKVMDYLKRILNQLLHEF